MFMEYSDTVLLKTQSAKPEKFMYSYLSNSNENINQSMVRNNLNVMKSQTT